MTTSRAPLLLMPEQEYPVRSLVVPDQTPIGAFAEQQAAPAVALFLSRASAIDPTFQPDSGELAAVAGICRRLEGVPLAIELSAARIRTMSASTLLDRLASPLAVLTDGYRDLPARQKSLRRTIDWSYDLLSPCEQTLLARLAVFPGGATLKAIEALQQLLGDDPQTTFATLEGLVRASLIQRGDHLGDIPRFVMLETIREYALELLTERDGLAAAQRAHGLYYLALSEQSNAVDEAGGNRDWIARLEPERDNLNAALQWAEVESDGLTNIRFVASLALFWLTTGSFSEGRHWLAKTVHATKEGSAELRALAYENLGRMEAHHSAFGAAEAAHYHALELFRQSGHQQQIAWVLHGLGFVFAAKGERARAITHLKESIALSENKGSSWGRERGVARFLLGAVLLTGGDRTDSEYARRLFDEALAVGQDAGNKLVEGTSLIGLSWVSFYDGEHDRAMSIGRGAVKLARAASLHHVEILATLGLGWFSLSERDSESATQYFHKALRGAVAREHWMNVADGLAGIAAAASNRDAHERAARLFAAAARLRDRVGSVMPPSNQAFQRELCEARSRCGDIEWQSGWEAGWSLSLDDAIAEALAIDV